MDALQIVDMYILLFFVSSLARFLYVAFLIFSDDYRLSFFLRDTRDEEIFQCIYADVGSRRYREGDFFACELLKVYSHLFEHLRIDDVRL